MNIFILFSAVQLKIVTFHIFTNVTVKMLLKEFYKGGFAHGHQLKNSR